MTKEDKRNYIEQNKLQKYKFLKGDLKSSRELIGGMTTELLMLKDLLVAFFIVLFVENPLLQILPSLTLFGACFAIILKFRVFKSKILLCTHLLNEGTFTVVTLVFFLYYVAGGSMSMNARYNYFGWGLISLIIITVVLNLVLGFMSAYYTIKEVCCKKKIDKELMAKKVLKKKVKEESSNSLPVDKKLKNDLGVKKGTKIKSEIVRLFFLKKINFEGC